MKGCTLGKQALFAIIAMIVSYALFTFQVTVGVDLFFSDKWQMYFYLSVCFIMLPLLIAKFLMNFKLRMLILDPIIMLVLAIIYCPNGWYLIIIRGLLSLNEGIADQLLFVIMMLTFHLIAFWLGKVAIRVVNFFITYNDE